jgi:hypothetical protein
VNIVQNLRLPAEILFMIMEFSDYVTQAVLSVCYSKTCWFYETHVMKRGVPGVPRVRPIALYAAVYLDTGKFGKRRHLAQLLDKWKGKDLAYHHDVGKWVDADEYEEYLVMRRETAIEEAQYARHAERERRWQARRDDISERNRDRRSRRHRAKWTLDRNQQAENRGEDIRGWTDPDDDSISAEERNSDDYPNFETDSDDTDQLSDHWFVPEKDPHWTTDSDEEELKEHSEEALEEDSKEASEAVSEEDTKKDSKKFFKKTSGKVFKNDLTELLAEAEEETSTYAADPGFTQEFDYDSGDDADSENNFSEAERSDAGSVR